MLTFSTIFMVLTCKFQIKKVKRSVKKMLAEGNIDYSKTIIFSETEISGAVWVEPREFRLDGIMYDIYQTDTLNGQLFHHCFEDQNETAWAELLLKSSDQDLPTNGKDAGKQNPLKYLMKDITLHHSNQLSGISYQLLVFQMNDIVGLKSQGVYANILAPPEA
jgi:hypothetical protein